MLRRTLFMFSGVAMMALATGCCCLSGYNRCNPCYSGYGGSQCGPGGCAPTYGYPTGPSSYAPGPESAAFAPMSTISSAPVYGPVYPTTVLAPSQALPTY